MTLYQKLRWLTRMGVDETISETPINRLKKQEKKIIPLGDISHATTAKPQTDTVVQAAITTAMSATDIPSLSQFLHTFEAATLKKRQPTPFLPVEMPRHL